MTRFARAHGSKSSNERLPEEATSWNVMKQQLKDRLKSAESVAEANISTQKVWKSSDFDQDTWNRNNIKWVDFEVDSGSATISENTKKKKKKKHMQTLVEDCSETMMHNKKKKKRDTDSAEYNINQDVGIGITSHINTTPQANTVEKTEKRKRKKTDEAITQTSTEKQKITSANRSKHSLDISKKLKMKQKEGTILGRHEELEEIIFEQNDESLKLSPENVKERNYTRKRKRSLNTLSDLDDTLPAKTFISKIKKNNKKIKSDNCIQSEALTIPCKKLKKMHGKKKTLARDEQEVNDNSNSVLDNFEEDDIETALHTESDVFQNGKKTKKNKIFKAENCVESETPPRKLKKMHVKKKIIASGEQEANDKTNSVIQDFEEDTAETTVHSESNVFQNGKKTKKKKIKLDKNDNSFQGVDHNLSSHNENVQVDDAKSQTALKSNMHIGQKKKKINLSGQQDSDSTFMKQYKFPQMNRGGKRDKHKRPYQGTTVLHVNGKTIEIVKFDGFPIKKEDAENLRNLKKKMIEKGLPLTDINITMKLERRKAEKALAREKKMVCFHCRKSGHVLSECPKLEQANVEDTITTGICFKCGSTEHKHFECRVSREQEFRYAKCFICNEQGHIARQCPDNPRGLYPKGGGCHICGDVTHLKKDCPDLIKEKEEKTIKLQTLSIKSSETLEDDKDSKTVPHKKIKKKKTVRF